MLRSAKLNAYTEESDAQYKNGTFEAFFPVYTVCPTLTGLWYGKDASSDSECDFVFCKYKLKPSVCFESSLIENTPLP